ncbi:MAG: Glutamine transport ATP-binding protein GlnQ [Deltaproteobacteria bacterium ADurb.Bin510]|nr:MAG: Glutamine transport ATP-binding protein GlnQ [Deltaproteobacteria bacterium ADurb.Bin510]
MIKLENVSKRFGDFVAVDNVSLAIEPGEKIAIIGPSGSGKTTLLRLINFLETLDSGSIYIDGEEVGYQHDRRGRPILDKHQVCKLRSEIGMVFQHFNLFPHMTCLENIMEGPVTVKGVSKEEARERGLKLLERVNLLDKQDVYPAFLSGGQKQRIAIARALAMQPKIILFDEPTSALDPELVGEVLTTIKDLATEGLTMLIVTHQMGFAREIADKVIFMDQGRFIFEGHPDDCFSEEMEHPRIKAFLRKIL